MVDTTLNQRSLTFLLISIALITFPHVWHVPVPLFGFFCFLWLWRFTSIWRSQWLPSRWLVLGLTLVGIGLLISQHQGLFGRDAGTRLFIVALGLKLMEIRNARDIYLIVYLAFVVAASQFLYEQSILMAGYIVLVCTVLLATLVIQNSSHVQTKTVVKSACVIILQALPIAVVTFVLFPRLEAPRWMWLKDDSKGLSGLTRTLEPGSISNLSLSDELVFRVRFKGGIPSPQLRYWRGPVYSNTDGVRWSMSNKDKEHTPQPTFVGESYEYVLLMEPQKENWVFALDIPQTYSPSLHRNAFYQLQTDKRPSERAEYLIISRPFYNTGDIDQAEYRENLQLPKAASEKQVGLIESLGGFDETPEQFIQNLLEYFRREEFFYTLTPPLMPVDPIDTFLFETRSGFCSHYATAFVYLLRIAKIPARVVGGYQGGEINSVGGFMEIRQADAHAWAEVWLKGKGWVRFDPTAAVAPERIERGVNIDRQIASGEVNFGAPVSESIALNWLKRSRQLWQSIDYNWQRWVINYHSVNQRQFFQLLGINGIAELAKWLVASVLGIILPLAWYLLRRKSMTTDTVARYYQQFCRKMAKAGIKINLGEGANDFAIRAKKHCPDLSPQIDQITATFIRLRYQRDAKAGDLQTLKTLVCELHI